MTLQLHRFADANQTAHALANRVGAQLGRALSDDGRQALLLVSGGRSPLPFFAALAQQDLPWERLAVSLVDERSVAFDDPDSNASLVAHYLLRDAAQAARLLPLMAPRQPGEDAWLWAQRSATAANASAALAQPTAIVLGLGTDGHTASLFADAPQWQEAITTERRYLALTPGQAPHARVSLSLHALAAQRTCYVWSNGAAKLDIIQQAQALADTLSKSASDIGVSMRDAGPFARLAIHPQVKLEVFHSDQ